MRGIEWSIEAAAVPAILLLKENPHLPCYIHSLIPSYSRPSFSLPLVFLLPRSVGRGRSVVS